MTNIPAHEQDGVSSPTDVFVAGQEDILGVEDAREKYPQFREQNVVVTNSGKLVVVCQARMKSRWSDRSGQDLVCKTSADGGKTWSPAQLIATHGLKSICPNAAVYDRDAGRIHVLYNLFSWDYPTPPEHIKHEMGERDCRQFAVVSGDDGQTWSAPRDITEMVGANGAVAVFGSGEGLQLRRGPHAGRLLVAGGDFYQGKKVLCYLSDDGGTTWRRGATVETPEKMAMASETKVAELPDGTLVLNSRSFVQTGDKQRLRTRAFSKDGGQTWTPLENDPALKTVSCNGSLIGVEHPRGKNGVVLLCSLPVGPQRTHGTIYVSFDEGRTWPRQKLIVPGGFAYSSLVILPGGDIGLFYETEKYQIIRCVRFGLGWLLGAGMETDAESYNKFVEEKLKATYPLTATRMLGEIGINRGLCLDIGSGAGQLDIELAKQSELTIVGLDIDPKMVEVARRNIKAAGFEERVTFIAGDAHKLPFPDDYADAIVSRGTWPFLDDKGKALLEVDRVLKPTGIAFVGGRYLYTPRKYIIDDDELRRIVRETGIPNAEVILERGQWVKIRGPQAPDKPAFVGGPSMFPRRVLADYGITKGKCLVIGQSFRGVEVDLAQLSELEITALYPSEKAAETGRAKVKEAGLSERITFKVGRPEELDFADGAFDLAVSVGALPFWKDREKALREIHRALRSPGAALLGGRYLHMPERIRVSPDALRETAKQTGIKDIRVLDDMGQWVEIRK